RGRRHDPARPGQAQPDRLPPRRQDGVGGLRQEPRPGRDRRRVEEATPPREDRRQPVQPRVHPDGRYLLLLDWSSETSNDEVIFYDLKEQKIDGRVEVSTWPAHAIFSRDGTLLYVSGETAGDVTVIDVAQRKAIARVVHGGGDAMGLALPADGKVLYAAAGENKMIVKIDTATNKTVGEIPLPGIAHEATLTLDGKHLYTTLRKANKIVVVSVADDKIVKVIP